MKETAFNLH